MSVFHRRRGDIVLYERAETFHFGPDIITSRRQRGRSEVAVFSGMNFASQSGFRIPDVNLTSDKTAPVES